MSEKRRGLGRGLGALIPTSLDGARSTRERPVDVFFPDARPEAANDGVAVGTVETDRSGALDAPTGPAAARVETERVTGATDLGRVPEDGRQGSTGAGSLATTLASSSTSNGEAHPSSSETRVHDDEDGAGQHESPVGGSAVIADDEQGQTPDGREPDGDDSVAGGGNGRPHGDLATVPEPRTSGEPQAADDDGLIPVPGAVFAELSLDEIRPNPRQPRTVFDEEALDELVGSIREIGVLQPVVVRRAGDGYELIMGERRWRAAGAAGLDTIPAIIRETGDEDLLRDALLENLHRSQLNPLEEAAAYQQLLDDFGCTHDELATRLHRSRPQISNTLRLLKLPPLVQRRVAAGVLSAGHARALLGLADGAAIERLAQRIVAEGLSVRAVEEIVALGGDGLVAKRRAVAPRAGVRNEALDALAGRLSDRFETRVKVALGKSRGRLTVEFASVQDLNRILGTLAPEDPGLFHG